MEGWQGERYPRGQPPASSHSCQVHQDSRARKVALPSTSNGYFFLADGDHTEQVPQGKKELSQEEGKFSDSPTPQLSSFVPPKLKEQRWINVTTSASTPLIMLYLSPMQQGHCHLGLLHASQLCHCAPSSSIVSAVCKIKMTRS